MPFILLAFLSACQSDRGTTALKSDSTSWAMVPFIKIDSVNPVLEPGQNTFVCPILNREVKWDEKDVFNPAAIVRNDTVWLIFRAEDKVGRYAGTSRLGLAYSVDGMTFTKLRQPVLYPENDSLKAFEWEGGVEDPRVVEKDDGSYMMTYTAYDGKTARLMLATSPDLRNWTKRGTVLQGKYKNRWSKSGAIVCRQDGSRVIATKINGRYWMYFGDTDLFIATSSDLLTWKPLQEKGDLKKVLSPRSGYFDSRLVESGPYGLIRDEGILLIYNGMNLDGEGRDTTVAPGAYCGGQALFNKDDPAELADRMESNFIKPDKNYEIDGQVNQVCFLEGMVHFKGKWLLYYGTADSRIAVAQRDGN